MHCSAPNWQPVRQPGANAADHSRGEILLDASTEVGAEVLRKRALNCWPWVRSLTQLPVAVIHSPAEITGAWPDQGDQLASATSLDPQDAKAILGVLVSDALDQPGEHLGIE